MTAPSFPSASSMCPVVAGPVGVWVDTGASNAIAFLGITANGVRITERAFFNEIHADDSGGEKGPPIDRQIMCYEHLIELELVRYIPAVLALVAIRVNPVIVSPYVGQLLGCSGGNFRVLLYAPSGGFTRNYETGTGAGKGNCTPIEAISYDPVGSQNTIARVTFVANSAAGVVPWDTQTS